MLWITILSIIPLWIGSTAAAPKASSGMPAESRVEPSAFRGIQLPAPRLHQVVDNSLFNAVGALRPGTDTTLSVVIPKAGDIFVLLLGDSVRWSFQAPDSSLIVPGETPNSPDYEYEDGGLRGFRLSRPATGRWMVHVRSVKRDPVAVHYTSIDVRDTPRNAHLQIMAESDLPHESNGAAPGEIFFVRTFMTDGGKLIPRVRWSVSAVTAEGTRITIPVYDDGRHGDGVAGDGVFVGAFRAGRTNEAYVLGATGRTEDGAEYTAHEAATVEEKTER